MVCLDLFNHHRPSHNPLAHGHIAHVVKQEKLGGGGRE